MTRPTTNDQGPGAPGAARGVLRILSGGAANGLVSRFEGRLAEDCDLGVEGDFGAVGGMRDRVVAGEAVDLVILTRALIDELAGAGHLDPGSVADLGAVVTGLAVREGARRPAVATAADLRAALSRAPALYVPHMTRSTAGRHVAGVIAALGLEEALSGRVREFGNGQTAMAALAADAVPGALGCTQITEILNTPGVDYAGDLPAEHGLSTVYTAAVAARAERPGAAAAMIGWLADPQAAETRRAAGFS